MSGTDGTPEVSKGDRIHITETNNRGGLAVGTEHTVEFYGTTESGAVYVTLVGQPLALVSALGDRWAVA